MKKYKKLIAILLSLLVVIVFVLLQVLKSDKKIDNTDVPEVYEFELQLDSLVKERRRQDFLSNSRFAFMIKNIENADTIEYGYANRAFYAFADFDSIHSAISIYSDKALITRSYFGEEEMVPVMHYDWNMYEWEKFR